MHAATNVATVDRRKCTHNVTILSVIGQIAARFKPQRIILFGCYDHNQPRPESNVDLLVVMDTPTQGRWQTATRQKLPF
jgi:predicted nucleotidyltransferase